MSETSMPGIPHLLDDALVFPDIPPYVGLRMVARTPADRSDVIDSVRFIVFGDGLNMDCLVDVFYLRHGMTLPDLLDELARDFEDARSRRAGPRGIWASGDDAMSITGERNERGHLELVLSATTCSLPRPWNLTGRILIEAGQVGNAARLLRHFWGVHNGSSYR